MAATSAPLDAAMTLGPATTAPHVGATHAPTLTPAEIVRRFATTAPRYTSYPTAPHFRADFDADAVRQAYATARGPLGLYIHVPFCERRCLYCGCHVEVARDRSLGGAYVDTLLRELDVQTTLTPISADRPLSVVALGGGTPTWLAPADLARLCAGIRARLPDHAGCEWSIEVDPRSLDDAGAEALCELGFTRFSLGVQDLDPGVQRAIGRPQPAARVERIARQLAASAPRDGLNFDLMYGLPQQTVGTMRATVRAAVAMGPTRFAVFGYAHVPWLRPHQRGMERTPLPDDAARLDLMWAAREELIAHGYLPLGLDQYALPSDPLAVAARQGRLGRNFMGYTDRGQAQDSDGKALDVDLLAIGASAIAQVGDAYAANTTDRALWAARVDSGTPAWARAYLRSDDDKRRGAVITALLCDLRVDKAAWTARFADHGQGDFDEAFADELQALAPYFEAGLLRQDASTLAIQGDGWLVARNVAAAFDRFLDGGQARYSRTV